MFWQLGQPESTVPKAHPIHVHLWSGQAKYWIEHRTPKLAHTGPSIVHNSDIPRTTKVENSDGNETLCKPLMKTIARNSSHNVWSTHVFHGSDPLVPINPTPYACKSTTYKPPEHLPPTWVFVHHPPRCELNRSNPLQAVLTWMF